MGGYLIWVGAVGGEIHTVYCRKITLAKDGTMSGTSKAL